MSQSLGRALRILIELGEGPRGLDELAATVGVHKTTVLRLLRTLEEERFVYRDGDHRFHLGRRMFALSAAALEQREIRGVAAPHLARLNEVTGQTVHLGVYEGGEVVYLDKYDSRHAIRMYSRIGLRMPLHATAIAKVLLADLPDGRRERVVGDIDFVRYTPNTITDPDALLAELARVAEQGYAVDDAEHETFIRCVAAPIRDVTGRVVAAASISVPDVVLPREQVMDLLPELLATTRAISAECGYREDAHRDPVRRAPRDESPRGMSSRDERTTT
ncbi:IclR family transcriptional regulator [Actinomadura rubrobrunea]|uniref:IclR family transcriptional regulator n=1 Tax=Actinomadura rubrobrunea TaxID=115335 RepID=A0A9W6UUA2_9ACTN|nr:IclR family transcriptional regulator [Actinomadura rubrobrunea]GLW64441.1 IclR family transcriptional regulator [Actinomadura rubrobrunea]